MSPKQLRPDSGNQSSPTADTFGRAAPDRNTECYHKNGPALLLTTPPTSRHGGASRPEVQP
jgi:hypothetical protein